MTNNHSKIVKNPRSSKKPKNRFGLYCKELRRVLGITITQAAEKIGVSQPYLSQLENGTEPLTSAALFKCLKGYMAFDGFTVELRLELLYEMLQTVESIELDLSTITLIHRENLLRLIAELVLNEQFPLDSFRTISWNPVNRCTETLKEAPPQQYEGFRIVSKLTLEPN
ncbi:MAG: helix-turn-helix transcriptional regulator [Treponema sp.]|jgi:transcriptional regulator with XRE-family HTH domain|nr:helix-turn-helix transcriptional regulator [Treponema sp.]